MEGPKYEGKNKPELPFSLFISCERRRKLLDSMMGETEVDRRRGDMILNNYKKQLAERMARSKVDCEDMQARANAGASQKSLSSGK